MEKGGRTKHNTTRALVLIGVPAAVCAGIYFTMLYVGKKRSVSTWPKLLSALSAVHRLVVRNVTQEDLAEHKMDTLLKEDWPDIAELQRAVYNMAMTKRRDKAAEMLKAAFERAEKGGKPHLAYELEMLYAEMLISMGNYEEAKKCKCLKDEKINDSRRPLFKAMISIGLGTDKESREHWEEFRVLQRNFSFPHILGDKWPYNHEDSFDEFKKVVKQDEPNCMCTGLS